MVDGVIGRTISQLDLPKYVTDYFRIIFKYDNQLWQPISFLFKSHWLSHIDFPELDPNSWFFFPNQGWKTFVVIIKLRYLKYTLKSEHTQVFGNLDFQFESCRVVVSNMDLQADQGALFDEAMRTMFKNTLDLLDFLWEMKSK